MKKFSKSNKLRLSKTKKYYLENHTKAKSFKNYRKSKRNNLKLNYK